VRPAEGQCFGRATGVLTPSKAAPECPAAGRAGGRAAALAEPPAPCHFRCMEWRTTGQAAKRPGIVEPCIPTRAAKPPVGPQWIQEIKHDGYRLIARKRHGRVRLFTRRGFDWTERYPRISAAVAALRPATVTQG
jgi:ATP-dependent DNA ligase